MAKRPFGRPRKGEGGTRVADYPRQVVRMPPEQKKRLHHTSKVLGRSASDILAGAFAAFYRVGLTAEQREEVERLMVERGEA